ncbi:MAG: restriction endonuclease [Burkholderiales bacterium]|nr:restriction endonuclease [Opitutaceae bacterium]
MTAGSLAEMAMWVAENRAVARTIYEITPPDSGRFIAAEQLESWLDRELRGFPVQGLPLRTRSKVVKRRICEVLGYAVPTSFKRTRPLARFPCQDFDLYVQTSDNLQVWNDALSATRRYVLIREAGGVLAKVRVVTGVDLAVLDTTGTLTQKYQARLAVSKDASELISALDTERLGLILAKRTPAKIQGMPTAAPKAGKILSIAEVWRRLSPLIGRSFANAGADQERNRGAALHALVCAALGYERYSDDGRFPDVRHQLLEVKLQTAPTIDLGLVTPDSAEFLDLETAGLEPLRHRDVRYALFSAVIEGTQVRLTGLHLTTGADFFSRFPRFGGKVLNRKLQLRMPKGFL